MYLLHTTQNQRHRRSYIVHACVATRLNREIRPRRPGTPTRRARTQQETSL
ncbi:unnamed protein product [Ectocarpus sp. CCAP 1310/34]|nr:unnamed protein product [Ectocarpus sp. CCAP 1310/34]